MNAIGNYVTPAFVFAREHITMLSIPQPTSHKLQLPGQTFFWSLKNILQSKDQQVDGKSSWPARDKL